MGAELPVLSRLNPCNNPDCYAPLRPIGRALASLYFGFTYGTDCACCMAVRLLLALTLASLTGAGAMYACGGSH